MLMFETDTHPGKMRILFIGHASSSHTHSWLDLLADAPINVRLFGLPSGYPPTEFRVRTYLTTPYLPEGLDPDTRKCLHPTPEDILRERRRNESAAMRHRKNLEQLYREIAELRQEVRRLGKERAENAVLLEQMTEEITKLETDHFYWLRASTRETLRRVRKRLKLISSRLAPESFEDHSGSKELSGTSGQEHHATSVQVSNGIVDAATGHSESNLMQTDSAATPANTDEEEAWTPPASSHIEWLEKIIDSWRPNIIHTLGLDPASYIYLMVHWRLKEKPKWVVQVRGGPDLALNRFLPEFRERILQVLQHCDKIIADNDQNYAIARDMGLAEEKCCSLGAVPGTGGISITEMIDKWTKLPSKRERLILWPKAFECPQSKALPVMEAMKLAWDDIQPCRIIMTAVIQEEIHMWYRTFSRAMQERCQLRERIPRKELLGLMLNARVLLAPSLSDGVPNSMYEAMAAGAFPIVSPLETISEVVAAEHNVLFARNLHPEEIAEALKRSMTDDYLVDTAANINFELVKRIADRSAIGPQVASFYEELAAW